MCDFFRSHPSLESVELVEALDRHLPNRAKDDIGKALMANKAKKLGFLGLSGAKGLETKAVNALHRALADRDMLIDAGRAAPSAPQQQVVDVVVTELATLGLPQPRFDPTEHSSGVRLQHLENTKSLKPVTARKAAAAPSKPRKRGRKAVVA